MNQLISMTINGELDALSFTSAPAVASLLEQAKSLGAQEIILHARENAVNFYKHCGYTVVEKSYLMWGEIQHYLMKKDLS